MRKRKKGLIAALIAANLLMLAVGILTIPPNLRSAAEPKGTPFAEAPEPPALTENDPFVDPAGEDPFGASGEDPAPESGERYSTDERPDLGDFQWYLEGVRYDGPPTTAVNIRDLNQLTGGWKALIVYDPDDEFGSNAFDFLNITMTGTEESLRLILDWYMIFWSWEGETFDLTDMEDTVYNGRWEDGSLWVSGAGTIRLSQFYSFYHTQYAIGTMDTPDGIPALVALVRP